MDFHTRDLPLVDGRTTNSLEEGPSCLRYETCAPHPIEAAQSKGNESRNNLADHMLTGIYGSHMVMRYKMEEALLSELDTRPGLPKRNLHMDILKDQDEKLDFSDMLSVIGEAETSRPLDEQFESYQRDLI
mmetsp:Transcript_40596/g.56425  ORF Transcript_40596/g.56425 Transcript_40596/m.56425 type:complete len:131 (-) Transcript_40596:47-439(-)|eukprot:CAMPEP_0201489710 /NCGR_PEP_ID=MMETSP0151_2-20130828/23410_1 /ASSEMBLY_ACC=CAM_ASM_000257 /TAXON_ID=200890 /ORGANISM="Paramoeba atlantica, Strain 621/1 / CCAP 1560/9" /LENGTH=130 /DNA_ID=CAMNT_0047875393 /DNA_START=107 /DNA_END=499 /DNA_ORIENTATION=+